MLSQNVQPNRYFIIRKKERVRGREGKREEGIKIGRGRKAGRWKGLEIHTLGAPAKSPSGTGSQGLSRLGTALGIASEKSGMPSPRDSGSLPNSASDIGVTLGPPHGIAEALPPHTPFPLSQRKKQDLDPGSETSLRPPAGEGLVNPSLILNKTAHMHTSALETHDFASICFLFQISGIGFVFRTDLGLCEGCRKEPGW